MVCIFGKSGLQLGLGDGFLDGFGVVELAASALAVGENGIAPFVVIELGLEVRGQQDLLDIGCVADFGAGERSQFGLQMMDLTKRGAVVEVVAAIGEEAALDDMMGILGGLAANYAFVVVAAEGAVAEGIAGEEFVKFHMAGLEADGTALVVAGLELGESYILEVDSGDGADELGRAGGSGELGKAEVLAAGNFFDEFAHGAGVAEVFVFGSEELLDVLVEDSGGFYVEVEAFGDEHIAGDFEELFFGVIGEVDSFVEAGHEAGVAF